MLRNPAKQRPQVSSQSRCQVRLLPLVSSTLLLGVFYGAPLIVRSQIDPAAIAQEPQTCQLPLIKPPARNLPPDPDWANLDDVAWQQERDAALNVSKLKIPNLKSIGFTSIAFSPDGKFLAAGTKYVTTRQTNSSRQPENEQKKPPFDFAPRDSRGWVLILSNIYTPQWKADKAYNSKREINSVAFNPQGQEQLLAAGGNDKGFVGLWDRSQWSQQTGDPKHQSNNQFSVNAVAFSPNGQMVASGGIGKRTGTWNALQRWELVGGKLRSPRSSLQDVRTKQPPDTVEDKEIFAVAFSPDSKILAGGGMTSWLKRDGTVFKVIKAQPFIHLWNAQTGKHLCSLNVPNTAAITSIAFSPDGTMLANANTIGNIQVWSLTNLNTPLSLDKHQGRVNTIAFSPGGQFLLSGGVDKTLKIWQAKSGQMIKSIERSSNGKPLFGSELITFAFRPDGQALVTVAQDETDTIRLFSPPSQ